MATAIDDKKPLPLRQKAAGWALWSLKTLAVAAAASVATVIGINPADKVREVVRVEVQPLVVAGGGAGGGYSTGWVPDAEATEVDLKTARFRTFADTPAGKVGDGELPAEVFLWKYVEKLTGKPTPLKDQNPTGSCVGFGSTTAIERSLATEILTRGGDPAEFAFFSEEVTYAGGKVQGARSLGASVSREDGSAGVFTKAWVTQLGGMVPKGRHGSYDLTEYDPARARSWNTSGVPPQLVEVAKKYPVKDSVRVLTWEQAKKALASGYGIAICSSLSFSYQRDGNGTAVETREGWNHCMTIDGYVVINGREYGHVENSWSNVPDRNGVRQGPAHKGPVGPGNPTTAGFWADARVIDRGLRQGDSYAYSGVTGFPVRKLNWFLAVPRRDRFLALTDFNFQQVR